MLSPRWFSFWSSFWCSFLWSQARFGDWENPSAEKKSFEFLRSCNTIKKEHSLGILKVVIVNYLVGTLASQAIRVWTQRLKQPSRRGMQSANFPKLYCMIVCHDHMKLYVFNCVCKMSQKQFWIHWAFPWMPPPTWAGWNWVFDLFCTVSCERDPNQCIFGRANYELWDGDEHTKHKRHIIIIRTLI